MIESGECQGEHRQTFCVENIRFVSSLALSLCVFPLFYLVLLLIPIKISINLQDIFSQE